MISVKEFKKHTRNIRIFRAYSALELAKQAALFPFDYYFKRGNSSYPLNIAFFITLRCNARCRMCKLGNALNPEGGEKEPTLEDIDNFFSGLKGIRPSVILYGGEPFIRKDTADIVAIVKRRALNCGIFTNGILLDWETIDRLIGLNLDFIVFSLQGIGDLHDKAVGVKGAYNKLVSNMELFIKHRSHTKVILQTIITEENLKYLADVARLGREKGADLVRFGHPTFFTPSDVKRNKGLEMRYVYDPSRKADSYYAAVKELKEKFGNLVIFLPDLNLNEVRGWYSNNFETKRKCLFLWRALFIYPNGDVHPCESLSYPIGNIYEKGFKEIWNDERYVELRRSVKKGLLPACARCCKL